MGVLELVTRGHQSGLERSILITYVPSEGGPVIAGTNIGSDADPAWIKNLRAHPHARARIDGEWRPVRAAFLEAGEYQAEWQKIVAAESAYATYPTLTHRAIPLVKLAAD